MSQVICECPHPLTSHGRRGCMFCPCRGKAKRPVFTEKEIDVLIALINIAEANVDNEGDYQDFDYKSMDSACKKLIAYSGVQP